jgi:hypothetical protein
MGLCRFKGETAFERLFHQHNAAARRIHLLTEFAIGGTGRETEPAMNTRLHGPGHSRSEGAELFGWD